ncbi:unnamed protein product, partial [Heterosigma akashiwo]
MSDFQLHKVNCLSKLDKSAAGRIDPQCVEICQAINDLTDFYTTSSCAGRTLIWRGCGYKGTQGKRFERFRVNHDLIEDVDEYLQLDGLDDDVGNDVPVHHEEEDSLGQPPSPDAPAMAPLAQSEDLDLESDGTLWLRMEPFILHVSCRTLPAAEALIAACRRAFKNVGLQSWRERKYMVCVWGDDGLDMPITAPGSGGAAPLFPLPAQRAWLRDIVNRKHRRNWGKIARLVAAVRAMENVAYDDPPAQALFGAPPPEGEGEEEAGSGGGGGGPRPRHFDVIGDVAVVHELPPGCAGPEGRRAVGAAVLATNPRKIKVCVLRRGRLEGAAKAHGVELLAGRDRRPLVTTHWESGVGCVVRVGEVFFSPRMAPERLRLCRSVGPGERVLCLFSGVGAEALQIAARTAAAAVVCVELNPVAVACLRKGVARLSPEHGPEQDPPPPPSCRCWRGTRWRCCPGCPSQRIRPARVAHDPRAGGAAAAAAAKRAFLAALLPALRPGGEVHWYDFATKAEVAAGCPRTRALVAGCCAAAGLAAEFLHAGPAGRRCVAAGQWRVCVDFRVRPL